MGRTITAGSDHPPAVRICRITDATRALLDRVAPEVFDAPIDPERLAHFLTLPGHVLFVAHDGAETVGQCLGVVYWAVDRPPQLLIENLGVTPGRRRGGIGRALLGAVIAEGETMGCRSMWLGADPDSDSAAPFYRALNLPLRAAGFAEIDLPRRSR